MVSSPGPVAIAAGDRRGLDSLPGEPTLPARIPFLFPAPITLTQSDPAPSPCGYGRALSSISELCACLVLLLTYMRVCMGPRAVFTLSVRVNVGTGVM